MPVLAVVIIGILVIILISERSQAPTKKSSQLAVKWGEADVRETRKTTDKHFMVAAIWNN